MNIVNSAGSLERETELEMGLPGQNAIKLYRVELITTEDGQFFLDVSVSWEQNRAVQIVYMSHRVDISHTGGKVADGEVSYWGWGLREHI